MRGIWHSSHMLVVAASCSSTVQALQAKSNFLCISTPGTSSVLKAQKQTDVAGAAPVGAQTPPSVPSADLAACGMLLWASHPIFYCLVPHQSNLESN